MKQEGRRLGRFPQVVENEPLPRRADMLWLHEIPDLGAPHLEMLTVDLSHGARADNEDLHPRGVLRPDPACKPAPCACPIRAPATGIRKTGRELEGPHNHVHHDLVAVEV